MGTPIEAFAAFTRGRPTALKKAQVEGVKIVGYTGNYIPTEIIYAAGAKAYPLWRGGEPEPPDAALEETLRFLNPLHRTAIGMHLLGVDPVTPFLDMLAISVTDCHIARIAEIFEDKGIETFKVGVPAEWQSDSDFRYYIEKVRSFREKLEELVSAPIDDGKIVEQIGYTNQIKGLLRKIDNLRKLPDPPIDGTTFIRLNHCVALCDPLDAIEHLQVIYDWLAARTNATATSDKTRIMLVGRAVGIGDYLVVKTLEDAGAIVVTELLDEAYFRFAKDADIEGDPIESICRNVYRDCVPIDNFQPAWSMRYDYMKQAAKDYAVDGFLWYQLLYDEVYDMEYCCFSKLAARDGLRFSTVQTSYEYTREAMGPLTTKLETIVETFRGGRQ